MDNTDTASARELLLKAIQEAAQDTPQKAEEKKPPTRIYWKLDIDQFANIWSVADGGDEKDFKQIRALFCILQNITAQNNTLAITYQAIAEETGISQDTIVRIMRRLQEKDFLQKMRNGLYIVNPYTLMRGRDYIRLTYLYRAYCAVRDANNPNKVEELEEPEKTHKRGKRPQQDKQEDQNSSDAAGDATDDAASQEETSDKQKEETPAEEFSRRAFWKIDLRRFSRIWYTRSKKGQMRPGKHDFKQLIVLAYILGHIVSGDNTLRATYQEIADNTGVSKDVVLHIMRRLQKRDFLQKKRNGLYVVNPYFLMMGDDRTRLPKLYRSYSDARWRNLERKRLEEERRLESPPKDGDGAKRGRKPKSSTTPPDVIVDAPSAEDGLFYWESIYALDELYGMEEESIEEEMTMEDMEQMDKLLMEQVLIGGDIGVMEYLEHLVAAEAAAIKAEMAANRDKSGK